MKTIATASFLIGALVLAFGVFRSIVTDGSIGGLGTMSMNGYYLLAMALFAQSAAAQLIWGCWRH